MANKPDIVALKWVVGLMNRQAENAEAALVEYSNNPGDRKPLLNCMWAIHQITSTLRALGMKKGEMLTLRWSAASILSIRTRSQGSDASSPWVA